MSVLAHKWVSSGALKGQAAFAKARVVVSLHGIMGQGRNWMTAARQLEDPLARRPQRGVVERSRSEQPIALRHVERALEEEEHVPQLAPLCSRRLRRRRRRGFIRRW